MCDPPAVLLMTMTCVPIFIGAAVEGIQNSTVRVLNAIAYGSLAGVMLGQVGPAVLRVPTQAIQDIDARASVFFGMALSFIIFIGVDGDNDVPADEAPTPITILPIAISMLADGLILGGSESKKQSVQLFLSAVLSIDNVFEGFDLGNQLRRNNPLPNVSPYVLASILVVMIAAFIPAGVMAGYMLRKFRLNRCLYIATSFALASIVWSVLIDLSSAIQPIRTRGERAAIAISFLIPVTGEWLVA